MKQLSTFGGRRFFIEDDEAENIKKFWVDDLSQPIELRSGCMINPKAIESIGDVETEPYYMGNKMDKYRKRVLVGGEWKNFAGNPADIEDRPIGAPSEFIKLENNNEYKKISN